LGDGGKINVQKEEMIIGRRRKINEQKEETIIRRRKKEKLAERGKEN
jgi:hypothetical protein